MTGARGLRPEFEFLLLAVEPEREDTGSRIRALAERPLDWQFVLQQAQVHNVAPLVYWGMKGLHLTAVPADVMAALKQRFDANFPRALFLTGELIKLVRRFEEHGIPAIAYKGPLLAEYYENIGLREFYDLDVLVGKNDVARVDAMLRSAGFRPRVYQSHPDEPHSLPFARAFDCEINYEHEKNGVLVDLHWALMPGFFALPGQAGQIWQRSIEVNLGGRRIQTLAPEDLLLILCVHGAKHTWQSLKWIVDVAHVAAAHANLDWDALIRRAAQLRTARVLLLGLSLAGDLLGAPLPATIRERIAADAKVPVLAETVRQQLFEHRLLRAGAESLFLMRSRDTFRDALRCGFERVFQPTKAEWWSLGLPRPLFSLYYLIRPMRLARKHAAGKPPD